MVTEGEVLEVNRVFLPHLVDIHSITEHKLMGAYVISLDIAQVSVKRIAYLEFLVDDELSQQDYGLGV